MKIITGKPSEMPKMWGIARRKPKFVPEVATSALLGPGVKAAVNERMHSVIMLSNPIEQRLSRQAKFAINPLSF